MSEAKQNYYVKSNFERIPDDYYPTIDTRCVDGLLKFCILPDSKIIDPCAPNGSGIVNALVDRHYSAMGSGDAFEPSIDADWIVCNPPYKRGLVDRIINRQVARIGSIFGVAMLLRANFDYAKTRRAMFADNPLYWGKIQLCFRPIWIEPKPGEKVVEPIHNYAWYIWLTTHDPKKNAKKIVEYYYPPK